MELVNINDLCTVAEYATELSVTQTTIYNRIKEGKIKSFKIGEITIIIREDNGDKKP